jgi:hypothetical protein
MPERSFPQHILKNGQRMCITSPPENLQEDTTYETDERAILKFILNN